MRASSEEPFKKLTPLPGALYSRVTDDKGTVIIPDIPAFTHDFEVYDSKFEAPIQDPKASRSRFVLVTFSPGETNKMELVLEPKGSDPIGN